MKPNEHSENSYQLKRRDFSKKLGLMLGSSFAVNQYLLNQALAQTTKLQNVRLLLGAPPGGVGDLMARRLAEKLRGVYAQNIFVENKPGAGGQLAINTTKGSLEDGATLLLTPSSPMSLYPATYKQLPYKPELDFKPIALVAYSAMAFAVGPAIPANVKRLDDFLALAKTKPEVGSYGSAAAGSIPHLLAASIAHSSGVTLTHVAYKGSAPAVQDLRAGILPALCGPLGTFLPFLGSGQIRLLAVSGDKRSSFTPDVLTFRESGFSISAREWYGFFAPAGTREELVDAASRAILSSMKTPSMLDTLAQFGLESGFGGPKELAAQLRLDRMEWASQVSKIGFSAET
jgi:tripartite-type tricarboxylate transporter receptor subunit TctC